MLLISELLNCHLQHKKLCHQNLLNNKMLVLKVFCDETVAALCVKFLEAEDTALFIQTVFKWRITVNSKAKGLDIRLNII